jgi:hypothetical protein
LVAALLNRAVPRAGSVVIRYALIVSIRAVNGTIDSYTSVMTEVATQVELAV